MPRLLPFAILVASTAIIGGSFAAVKTQSKPVGWKTASSTGVKISLPQFMRSIDLTRKDIDGIAANLQKEHPENPSLAETIHRMMQAGTFKMFSISLKPPTKGFANNFNLVVIPTMGMDLKQLFKANLDAIPSMAVEGSVTHKMMHLPAGDAALFTANIKAGPRPNAMVCYLMVKGTMQYVFTFSSAVEDKKAWTSMATQAMQTVQIGK